MRTLPLLLLTLRARRRRIALLLAFAALFLVAGLTARLATGQDGHVEFDALFRIGGYPLVSTMLLLGWLLGRFGMIAAFVLLAGVCSADRDDGSARLLLARPVGRVPLYFGRFALLALAAFLISAALMPVFDTIMLGHWGGPMTFVLIASYVLAFGSLTFLLSVWTRADAWLALLLALFAMVWHALRRGDLLAATPPGVREVVTLLLPPHGAIMQIERAFAQGQGVIPWPAVFFVVLYAALLLLLAAVSLNRRET